MKSGFKTTEFWVTVLFDAGLVVTNLSSLNFFPPQYAALAGSVATGLYAISRGVAKIAPQVAAAEKPSVPAAPAPAAPATPPEPTSAG